MTLDELLAKAAESRTTVQLRVTIKKIDNEKQIATGEVYAPLIIDSHGDMMLAEDVEILAHSFMAKSLNSRIDIMHNNRPALAVAVESFIAKGNSEFNEGAWVVSIKVHDDDLWDDIKTGKLNGYSMEAMVLKVPAIVELEITNQVFGFTEENDGHDHVYYVLVDDNGRVTGGKTSVDAGHQHEIGSGTATEDAEDHSHRYFLP